jgi:hypothetical protein
MIKIINKNYILIFILTVLFFFLKYFYSFFLFKEDYLITKILLETSDIQYYPLVESLSRFDFSPSFNDHFIAQKIITFPILSLIWHVILFKFFNYYSFIILEFIFKFLTFLILYKIFRKLDINSICSIFFSFLILALPSFFYFIALVNFKNFNLINQLININLGYRFPRPLVTFFYLILFLYFLICYCQNKYKKKIFFFIPISIVLAFLANSFFYLFISCSLLLIILLITKVKKNFFYFIKKNILILSCGIFIILVGLFLVFFQSFYGEADYSRKIGLFDINFQDKIFLFKYFLLSILKLETISLILSSLVLKFFSKKIFFQKNIVNIINIFFYLFVCSIIAPFVFVFLSSKVISLYHFFDLIIFTGVYYILFNVIIYLYYRFKSLLANSILVYFLFFIFSLVVLLNYKFIAVNINQRQDINLINNFLISNNIANTNKTLFTNDLHVINLWLHHKNKYLSIPEGFSNSLTDNQVEKSLFSLFKSLNINNNEFKKFLDIKGADGRSFFSTYFFIYKYQANSLKHFSDINKYLPDQKNQILNTSPLRASSNIMPEDEMLNIISRYQSFNDKIQNYPDIIIINKNLFIDFYSQQYLKVLDTINFAIYLKS